MSLSNIITQTVTISHRVFLCDMQPVTVVDDAIDKHDKHTNTISVNTRRTTY